MSTHRLFSGRRATDRRAPEGWAQPLRSGLLVSLLVSLFVSAFASTTVADGKPTTTDGAVLDGANRFQVELGPTWIGASGPAATATSTEGEVFVVGKWSRPDISATVTVLRVNFGNRGAWRGDKQFFSNVEKGVVGSTPGIRSVKRSRGKVGIVPHLDLRFLRQSKESPHASMRFLFFRRYTLIATVTGTRASKRTAARVVKSFKPYFE